MTLAKTTLRRLLALLVLIGVLAPAAARAQANASSIPLLPSRGAQDGRIVVLLFSDFECPYCARVEPALEEVRKAFAKDVQVIFKHTPLPIHARAPLAHEAALEAGRQGRFWEMHDLLFADQQHLDKIDLLARAAKLGLDMKEFTAALEDGRHKPAIARDLAEGRALGVTGTPTVFVNGQRMVGVPAAPQLIAYIRSVLTGKSTTDEEAPLDPKSFDLSGGYVRGPQDAPITVVEYSDFQCPFCGRASATMDAVWKAYGSKVRWVFQHFPLDFHPDAPLAHRASLAAGEQGKFWEMHDLIFANQRAMKRDDLVRHATGLGLDMTKFMKDLDDARFDPIVQRDLAEGLKLGIDATPTFFINGRRVVGAQPLEAFKTVIDRELGRNAVSFARPAAGASVAREVLTAAMSRGAADAPVTIRWFADFGNPLHKEAVGLLKKVLAAHPNDVKVVFSHRPLEGREEAIFAHEATLSAAEQGKFWEVHDLLVARPLQNKETLAANVARLGLDREWFEEGLDSGRARRALEDQLSEARDLQVRGTPTFFVNSKRVDGVITVDAIEALIADELKAARPPR